MFVPNVELALASGSHDRSLLEWPGAPISASMSMASFTPIIPFDLIQGIRLAQALMESNFQVCIPAEHGEKFAILREKFGARFRDGSERCQSMNDLRVIHSEPLTAVGSIERPLIFPHAIVSHCRSIWQGERKTVYSFAGLLTDRRREIIKEWVHRNLPSHAGKLGNHDSRWRRWMTKWRLRSSGEIARVGELQLWSSDRGRTFPIKSWDEDYYRFLAGSQFVLCPSGDYTWTYRFYEAILCGAIPIVEEGCKAYEGYRFRMMGEPAGGMRWDPEIAASNFKRCVVQLTIPTDQLDAELARLLQGRESSS